MAESTELVADRRLFADASGKPVEASDPARASLIAGEGSPISAADAEKFGLSAEGGRVTYAGDASAPKAVVPAAPAVAPAPAPAASLTPNPRFAGRR